MLTEKTKLTVERLDLQDPRYRKFLVNSKHTLFHTPEWLSFMEKVNSVESACYGCLENGEVRAVLTGFLFDWKLGKNFFSSIFDGGYLGPEERSRLFFDALTPVLKKDNVTSIRVMKTFSASCEAGESFKVVEASQHVVDLEGVDEDFLWNKIYKNRVRKAVRKAEREGVQVVPMRTSSDMSRLLELNRETVRRRKAFYVFNTKMAGGLYHEYLLTGKGAGWLAYKDGVAISGLFNLYSQNTSHGLISGSLGEYLHLPANDLLIHEGIKDTIKKGKRYFDFMCSLAGFEQIKSFKQKFGASEYPACFYQKDIAPIRAGIWSLLWSVLHSPLGSWAARRILK